eukprot:TRINITY_DN65655_c0_g1_i1.p1 TRINITY_DN65655_c0_g1~~TRINITY_DN65655_c0_g1_i1.p1  ORF type:complete len:401 (+),score=45.06 TRINITY_DN65655_c0_g1_i1:118-1203(+)
MICAFVLQVVKCVGSRAGYAVKNIDPQGLLYLPSAPLFVFSLLYQGTSLGAVRLVLHPTHIGMFFVGLATLFVCILVPCLLFRHVTRSVPHLACYCEDSELPENQGFGGICKRMLVGAGDWVNTHPDTRWVRRYGTVVRAYRQEFVWFAIVEFSGSLAVSAIAALDASTTVGCGHKKLATSIVLGSLSVIVAVLWPHARHHNACLDFIVLSLQATGSLLMAIGYYTGSSSAPMSGLPFDTARRTFQMALVILLTKSVLDVVAESVNFFDGRMQRLQRQYQAMQCMVPLASVSEVPLLPVSPSFNTLTQQTDSPHVALDSASSPSSRFGSLLPAQSFPCRRSPSPPELISTLLSLQPSRLSP